MPLAQPQLGTLSALVTAALQVVREALPGTDCRLELGTEHPPPAPGEFTWPISDPSTCDSLGRLRLRHADSGDPQTRAVLDSTAHLIATAVQRSRDPSTDSTSEAHHGRQLLRFALDNTPDPMFLVASDGRFVDVNQAACLRLGYTRQELLRMSVPDVDPATKAPFKPLSYKPGQPTFRTTLRTRSGHTFPVELVKNIVQFDGESYVCATGRDISQREAAERDRDERDRLLQEIIEGVQDPIYIKDLDSRYVLINSAISKLAGRPREDIIGRTDHELFDSRPADSALAVDRRVLETGEPQSFEVELTPADGETRWFFITKYPRRDADGQLIGVIGVARDVSERHMADRERDRLARQMRQSQKMEALGQLAGGVAHDFNNVLTAVLGNAELLLTPPMGGQALPPDLARTALEQIREAGQRATSLTRQLLAFSRQQVTELRLVDVKQIVADTSTLMRRLLGENIQLELAIPPEAAVVMADTGQIEQILMNLMLNARDAMPRGGTLKLTVRHGALRPEVREQLEAPRDGQYVELRCDDSGVGIDEPLRERIFEPFFTTKPQGRGVGLGLSTVYGNVRQLEGHILVESVPGEGSSFRVFLPAAEGNEAADEKEATALTRSCGERVLVCEDDRLVREVTCLTLRAAGYNVVAAEHGREALQALADMQDPIDLLISDVVMPEMNGRDLFSELEVRQPSMRVLFVSGYTADVLDAQGVRSTGVEFLHKPFTPEVLLRRVRQLLDQPARRT